MRNLLQSNKVLTPARFLFKWIPACTGMTMLFLFLFTPSPALAATVTWDGGSSGTLTQNNKVQQVLTGTLTINSGGNLNHQANTTTTLPLQVKLFYTTCK